MAGKIYCNGGERETSQNKERMSYTIKKKMHQQFKLKQRNCSRHVTIIKR